MTNKALGVLAGLSLALLLLAIVDPWQGAPGRAGRLLVDPASAASITQLVLEDESSRFEVVRQGEDAYQLTAPLVAPAETSAVQQMLQAMSLLRSRRQADVDDVDDLKTPALVIEYHSSEGTEQLSIGAASGDGRHRWVRSGTSKQAHLVEAHLVEEILSARSNLLSGSVLPFALSRTEPLRIEGPASWLSFQDQRVWTSDVPTPMPAAARAKELYATVRAMRFDSVEARGNETCTPSRTLRIEHGDRIASLEECGRCADSRVQVAVDQRIGCLDAEPWNALVAALEQPTSILDVELVPAQPVGFSLTCGSEVLKVEAAKVELARLRGWTRDLNASVLGILPDQKLAERCTLELSGEPSGRKIVFGRAGHRWLAAPDDRPYTLELEPAVASLLAVSALHFASLDLITEDPLFARRIELTRPAWPAPLAIVRDELGGSWSDPAGAIPGEQATALADAIRTRLAMLGAERYLEPGAAPPGKAALVIDIDFDAALGEGLHTYSVRIWRDASACTASVNQGPRARLAPELCDQLDAAIPR